MLKLNFVLAIRDSIMQMQVLVKKKCVYLFGKFTSDNIFLNVHNGEPLKCKNAKGQLSPLKGENY